MRALSRKLTYDAPSWPSTWTEQFIAQYVQAEWKIKNLELLTAQRSATMFTHCTALLQCACAILRWTDLACSVHQQNWRERYIHQQLETWKHSKESPDA